MGRLFGTDGVRGIANADLTPELAFSLGKAGAYVLGRTNKDKPVIIIGADTRLSGYMLENALTAGILAVGGNVIRAGVIPTPAIAYLVRYYNADAGAVISASHNTFEYNGMKFFNDQGFKLDDDIEDEIENLIIRDIDISNNVTGEAIGKCLEAEESMLDLYADFLVRSAGTDLNGVKVVLDCANGASYIVAEKVYRALGADVRIIGNDPNGLNINNGCGSTHPEKLQREVVRSDALIGMAFDGDADRLIAVDEKGELMDGDKLICICAKMLKDEGKLPDNRVTGTVMSNLGFYKYLEGIGCTVDVTGVGDRYVLERMLQTGSVIGGEQSGHIIFLNHTTTGDGILSSLQLMKAVLTSGKKPSELSDEIKIYPQVLKNAEVREEKKNKYERDDDIMNAISKVESEMEGKGRVLIRPSGTEPLVRVMLEGEDIELITKIADDLAALFTKKLG